MNDWLRKIEDSLSKDSLPAWEMAKIHNDEKKTKKNNGDTPKKTQTSLFCGEHTDLTRATLMFAEKESASLVVVRRLDDGKKIHT